MTQPVKLSRERWEMLRRGFVVTSDVPFVLNGITLPIALEVDGVTFLPAEYVPGGVDRPKRAFKLSPPPCA